MPAAERKRGCCGTRWLDPERMVAVAGRAVRLLGLPLLSEGRFCKAGADDGLLARPYEMADLSKGVQRSTTCAPTGGAGGGSRPSAAPSAIVVATGSWPLGGRCNGGGCNGERGRPRASKLNVWAETGRCNRLFVENEVGAEEAMGTSVRNGVGWLRCLAP